MPASGMFLLGVNGDLRNGYARFMFAGMAVPFAAVFCKRVWRP